MLSTVLLLLALLSGTTALPSEPAGMYRQGDMAQHTPIPVLPYLKQPLIYGNGTSLQYSCLENPMDGGAW